MRNYNPMKVLPSFITISVCSLVILLHTSVTRTYETHKNYPKQFPSVTLGYQTWMTSNWDHPALKSWYFDNDSISNKKYGRLYYFSNAVASAPPGWHLPSLDEWQTLINYFGGDDKALPHLIQDGKSGLNLLAGGNKSANISPEDIFNFKDDWGFYWTATTDGDQSAYAMHFEKENPAIIKTTYRKANGFSVRYVKD